MEEIDNQLANQQNPTSKQKQASNHLKQFLICQSNFFLQFLKLAIYFIISALIFGIFYRKNQIQMEQEKYFGQERVAHASQTRGLFPPISGDSSSIYGEWRVTFTNGVQEGIKNNVFSEYLLEFKPNDHLRIRKNGCSGDFIMKWKTYSFNLYIGEYQSNSDSDLVIEPDANDLLCIKNNGIFTDSLKFASIWSIYDSRLYILIERWDELTSRSSLSIMILQKRNNLK